eukprot:316683_1
MANPKNIIDIKSQSNKHPKAFICPISKDLMINPVILIADYQTYDKSNLEQWFKKQGNISPITKQPLKSPEFIPNLAIKTQIDEYIEKQNKLHESKFQSTFSCVSQWVDKSNAIRLLLLGDCSVGKSSIKKYIEFNTVNPISIQPTIGIESSYVHYNQSIQKHDVIVQITDICGHDRFRSVTKQCYRNINGAVLICSLDCTNSVQSLKHTWSHDVFEYAPDTCDWFYVVGGYSPPSNECFITFGDETLFSYKQQCLTGGIADFTVYFNSTDCSGDGTNMVVGPDGMIYGDCSVGNNCAYVKYEQTRYSAQATALCDESFAVGTEKGAVISDVCLGGQKYTCSGTGSSATLTRERFNDVECSNDAIETTVFHIGDCTDGIKLTSFECFSSEPTPPPAPAPTPSCDEDDSLDRQDCQDDGCEGDNVYLSFTLTFDVCTINPFKGKRKGLWNKISDCICQLGLDDEFDGMEIDYIDELETERRRLYRGSSQNKCKFDIVKYTKNKLTEDMKGCDEIDNSYGFEFGVEGCGKCVDLQNVYDGFEGYTSDEIIDRVTACSKAIAKAEDNIGFKIVDNVEFDYLLKDDNDECKLVTGGADIQFKYNVLVVIGVSAILSMYI